MRALLLRDLRLALRSAGGFGLSLAFFLILVLLVPFAVGPDTARLSAIAPGILWLGALLACLCRSTGCFNSIGRMARSIFWRPRRCRCPPPCWPRRRRIG
jgi:ABC-type transport system involved in cytochrome c biogenesis permease component